MTSQTMLRLPLLAVLLLHAAVSTPAAAREEAVEPAIRRLWARPGLALDCGLRSAPAHDRLRLRRNLEWTARIANLDSVRWTPAASETAGGPLEGLLELEASGSMPPASGTVSVSIRADGLVLEREPLERRGHVRIVRPGRLSAVTRIPLEMLARLRPGTTLRGEGTEIEIEGRQRLLLFDVGFKLRGPLKVEDRRHLVLDADRLSIASLSAPGPVRDAIVDSLNPVFCLDWAMGSLAYLAELGIDRIEIRDGLLVLRTSGRLITAEAAEDAPMPAPRGEHGRPGH